jgi:hypothetical protein
VAAAVPAAMKRRRLNFKDMFPPYYLR